MSTDNVASGARRPGASLGGDGRSRPAWYVGTREKFINEGRDEITQQLALSAVRESLDVEGSQAAEWAASIDLLQKNLDERIPILQSALRTAEATSIKHVILEFDFRRRGLRMDCLLLGEGILFVVEFKRTRFERADRDQVMTYGVNLLEFHKHTRLWCDRDAAIVVPVLALTQGRHRPPPSWPGFADLSWQSLASKPLEADATSLHTALSLALAQRRSSSTVDANEWLGSPFEPSSSILDAALSLYGNHDVAAIQAHAAPKAAIDSSIAGIRERAREALAAGEYHIIFLSGAPGAGKTLVGLDVVMRGDTAHQAVFVTGNAPLVDVLNKALGASYRAQAKGTAAWIPTGYRRKDAPLVAAAATFKVVKAHAFLGHRGRPHGQHDGRILVFDEAQRTYEEGRLVMGARLEEHEADLVLKAQRASFPSGGSVVVALVGHDQAINKGERGISAWLEAADREGWTFSISDETLALAELAGSGGWAGHPSRRPLAHGHLRQSMRYYRNQEIERWVAAVLDGDAGIAQATASAAATHGDVIWLTRDLAVARRWARRQSLGSPRIGLIASGQARRLAAEGLFVDHKPDIANWMLAPTTDVRSSNALETVQNQYQIQGLELDYCIVCWDADLRRDGTQWRAYKLTGSDWKNDKGLGVAKNGYRVLLTRARQGMLIFVPRGDVSGADETRHPGFYDETASFLLACGAAPLATESDPRQPA